MVKIVTVVGARPQFIKAATVSRALRCQGFREVLLHTGQHYDADMSDVFFEQMGIPEPGYHLGVGGGRHGEMTGRQLEKIENILLQEKPDWVLVYGDTNSTLAGALAAAKLHIPVAHVEAGLRSFNRRMPEEINRVLTDHISALLFTPTAVAVDNLAAEGIAGSNVKLVGDVMYDATLHFKKRAVKPDWLDAMSVPEENFVLCTIHRAENTEDAMRLQAIMDGLGDSELAVVLPLHPRTKQVFQKTGMRIPTNVHLAPPVGYMEMLWLEMACRVIATDSGGVQKEAYFHGKPCITLRGETEWVELVEGGYNMLVGCDRSAIASALRDAEQPHHGIALYGDGNAASLIADALGTCNGR